MGVSIIPAERDDYVVVSVPETHAGLSALGEA
jgi:hypothetical protein